MAALRCGLRCDKNGGQKNCTKAARCQWNRRASLRPARPGRIGMRAARIGAFADALTNGQSGDWVLDDIARAFAAGAARCAVLELKLEAARRELAKVNNEFGSENAEWPEAWRRVAEVKERRPTVARQRDDVLR
ncbi:MAG: hypothetical protein IPK42_10755 [Betaproteobacteria bacterium]|nr:hypothetical protein [Betaproteobacteria bacterium]